MKLPNPIKLLAISAVVAPHCPAAVLSFSAATFSPATDPIVDTAQLTSYTNSSGTFSDLLGTVSISNANTLLATSDGYRNYWATDAGEIDGPSSMLGLDISHGTIDLETGDFQFGRLIGDGINTNGNDIFITDLGGLNNNTIFRPLDSSGALIGDFTLTLQGASFGTVSQQMTFRGDSTPTGEFGPNTGGAINGLGFDLSDFNGTGTLTGVTGVRISSTEGLDIGIAGTVIPEPSGAALLLLSSLGFLLRRRR